MNMLTVDGYHAKVVYDSETDSLRGEILGLSGSADFYAKSTSALKREFRASLKAYLAVCDEEGIEPRRHYSGKFNARIDPELHREVELKAKSLDVSINKLMADALERAVREDWPPC